MDEQIMIQMEEVKKVESCVFTGHRDLGKDFSVRALKKQIENMIERGVYVFYNGMAMGFDLKSAETVLNLKKKYPHIKLIACMPFYEQEKYFSEQDKKRYARILKKADEKVYVSERYFKGCMQLRDRYMADRGDVMIAYCKKDVGGTAYTVKYFQKKYPLKELILL